MKKKIVTLAVALLPVVAWADPVQIRASAPGQAQCAPTSPGENAAAAEATSRQRAAGRLPALRPNDKLARAAAQHACDMARRGVMAHGGSRSSGPSQRVKGAGYRPRITAENIAAGPFDLATVLASWNASSGHLGNVMLPQVRDFGIGRAVGSDGRTVFWTAVYAAPG
ncbi:CAP domain-containing protein [Paracoccus sp. MC1854]|uniref:CAP domain-containing protein n=1 Tax=Paracoccus sp. MC1854 TaxID=2760306 RepID=UPI001604008B|nr:CAP domain-containing protein [Paracoccus sp. MC1854]MBB1490728.1 CAP domain-containing protein [Paracoccus sp. MC1854]